MTNKYLEKIAGTVHDFPDRGKNQRMHNESVFRRQRFAAMFGLRDKLKRTPPPKKENIYKMKQSPRQLLKKYGPAAAVAGVAGAAYVYHKNKAKDKHE